MNKYFLVLLLALATVIRAEGETDMDKPAAPGDAGVLGKGMLRVARPSDNLDALVHFYRDGLGLEIVGSFNAHNGFDGVMLGQKHGPYHFEFTHKIGHKVGRAPTQDNLIVFYMPNNEEWKQAIGRMESAGYKPVKSYNPYWDQVGATFEDPDGYRVVLQNAEWVNK